MKSRDLHLTSPIETGADVQKLQLRLKTLGYNPGPIDGKYGATTAAAVRAFQKAHKLHQDGVVGAKTRAALAVKSKPKPAPAPSKTSTGVKLLHKAQQYVGITESPRGSNRNQFGKWFGVDGVAWCAIFMSFCAYKATGLILCKGLRAPGCYPNGCTYVPTLKAWLISSGQWIGRTTPQPGDIAIYNWDGGDPDHVGVVENYLGGGKFTAIEGNTAVGNDSNGGEVMRRIRYISQVDGFGRLR